ncbi:MAG: hypothetical protein GEU75_15810 [Dehalococcoidia bacterium]|nr:hypothetical protein [Dehalococcoidia bacterium]
MLQISDSAKTLLKSSLDNETSKPGEVYRLVIVEDRLGLSLGQPEEGDVLYEQDGAAVLATPPEVANELDSTIDIDVTNEGPRLVLVA